MEPVSITSLAVVMAAVTGTIEIIKLLISKIGKGSGASSHKIELERTSHKMELERTRYERLDKDVEKIAGLLDSVSRSQERLADKLDSVTFFCPNQHLIERALLPHDIRQNTQHNGTIVKMD